MLAGGNAVFFLTLWLLRKYDKVYLDQVIYQMKASTEGVYRSIAGSAVIHVGVFGILAMCAEIFLFRLLSGDLAKLFEKFKKYEDYCKSSVCRFFKGRGLSLSLLVLVTGLCFFTVNLDVVGYAEIHYEESDFIEENYADPDEIKLSFPQEKRNLVYIFLESMENTFAEPSAGGKVTADFIPELSLLSRENVNFSNDEGLGGALSFSGTTWTAAAMVAQTSGIPVKVMITADAYGKDGEYLPGAVSIGDILKKEGYDQTLLVGSDADFHGRAPYFDMHGNYDILDTESLKAQGRLDPDYREWWGFEDEKLFDFAKQELLRLSAGDAPFNLTMLTADTHFPDGYHCQVCQDEYPEQYPTVARCSSRMVYDFIRWIQQQPFYENTTIILCGDHLTMDPDFMQEVDENYQRTIYNCIINAPLEPVQEKNREFGTYDMFPTTLAALGVQIEGDRLGLGTNLFSAKQTLCEMYGFEALDWELQKRSEFYNTRFLGLGDEE
jgi:phosphoglycerol transferase